MSKKTKIMILILLAMQLTLLLSACMPGFVKIRTDTEVEVRPQIHASELWDGLAPMYQGAGTTMLAGR